MCSVMKKILLMIPVALLPVMAAAQDTTQTEPESGFGAIKRGFGMIFDGLKDEVDPAIDGLKDKAGTLKDKAYETGPELRDWVASMGPALRDLAAKVGDLNDYQKPEKLPNGDIILRRKVPLDPENPAQSDLPEGQIEL